MDATHYRDMYRARTASRRAGIVIVSPGGMTGGGGMGSVTRAMATWWRASGAFGNVHVLDPRGEGSIWGSPFYFVFAILRLIWLRLAGAKILHLQVSERTSFIRKGFLLQMGRLIGMKTVLHHHGAELIPFFENAPGPMRAIVKWVVTSADVNIVLGERWKSFLMEKMELSAGRITVLYNATRRLARKTNSYAWRSPHTHFVVIANLSPRKGIGEFLNAVHHLALAGMQLNITLAGGGAVQRYRQEAAELGLDETCKFTGWISQPDVEALLNSADALVLPSFEEGLPMVILEALSAGIPVITTPVGSIPEVLTDEKNCLMVSPGDVKGLARAMERVATDRALVELLSRNGRALHESEFEIDAYMNRVMHIYENLSV